MIRATGGLVLLLALPGGLHGQQSSSAGATSAASVTGVQVRQVPADRPQDLQSFDQRRGMLESHPFEPRSVPEPPIEQRTVFFEFPEPPPDPTVVLASAPDRHPAFAPSALYGAGWLVPPGARPERLGTVDGLLGWPSELGDIYGRVFEGVRIHMAAEGTPQVGEEFLLYAVDRTIDRVGRVAVPSGRVRVVEVNGSDVLAEVEQVLGKVRPGDLVTRVPVFTLEPGVHPGQIEAGVEGRILALQREHATQKVGDLAFIDLGLDQGLALGDELVGIAEDEVRWTGRDLARFQVVGLREDTGTVRVVSTVDPRSVRPGLRLVLDRKMP